MKSRKSLLLILLACSSLLFLVGPRPGRALSPHAPIFITSVSGVENFTSVASSGTGVPGDPYIIKDWEITANTTAGIHIKNTHSYFMIRNVFIHPSNLTPGSSGILLESVMNGQIENVRIANFTYGLWLTVGSTNKITSNSIWNNTYGISMSGSDNIISDNHVYNNSYYGMWISGSTANIFTGNNASANGNGRCVDCNGAGFVIAGSSNNLFENNTLLANDFYGFRTAFSTGNTYKNNNVAGNQFGTIFEQSTGNQVLENKLTNNDFGIGLEFGNTYNNLTMNRLTNNGYGIYIVNGSRNIVYNNYLQNSNNAFDDWNYTKGSIPNAWNITKALGTNILGGPFLGGNFYSDYTSTVHCSPCDPDGDGMGDTPYPILGGIPGHPSQDLLPLLQTQPTIVQDVSVRRVTAQPASARTGNTVTVTVAAFNEGTVFESFAVSTYANQIGIGPIQNIPNLAPLSGATFTLSWDTTGLAAGTYVLEANASIVPGETYTANNISPQTIVNLLANQSPVAQFTISTTSPLVGQAVTLDASTSYDPDGTISNYSWNLGDGTTSTGATATHSYATAGTFTIILTVKDNEGATNSASKALTASSNQPGSPVNFQLTATSGKTTLTWSPPNITGGSSIIRYRIYRETSSSQSLVWLANTTDTSYVDTTVSNGQTYYYKVTAVNGAGMESPLESSIQKDVLIPGGVSNPPNNLPVWLAIAAAVILASMLGAVVIRRRTKPGPRIA